MGGEAGLANAAASGSDGGLRALVHAKDWSATPLGPRAGWPACLQTIVDLILAAPLPMMVLWGAELIQIYNDGYAPLAAARHPAALGQAPRDCWPDLWDSHHSSFRAVLGGAARVLKAQPLTALRDGLPVQAWFDLACSPLRDDTGAVAGVLVTAVETSGPVAADLRAMPGPSDTAEILESISDAFYAVDHDWRFTYINRKAEEVWGRRREDLLGKAFLDEFPQAAGSAAHEAHRLAARERRVVHLETVSPVLGFWLDISIYPSGNGLSVYFRNIGERKRSEQALRESEALFRALVNASSDAVYRMAPDWSEMRQLEGRDFIADIGGPGRNWMERYIPPVDRPTIRAAIDAAIRSRSVFELEHRVIRADGSPGWVLSRAIPLFDAQGQISEWFGTASDITERTRAEQALRRSQAETERQRRLYEAILTNTPDLAYVFDRQHRFIYANEVLLKMWGRGWEDAIGKTCLELGYPDWHAAMHDREIEQVLATRQPVRGEVPFTGTFGRRIYDYIFVPVLGPDGTVEAVAGTTRDVTDRKRMEEAQAESEARLKAIFDTAPVGIVFAEAPSGRILAANRQAEIIFGHPILYSPDLAHYGDWIAFHPDGRRVDGLEYPMARVLNGEDRAELEVLYQRGDGQRAWVRLFASPILADGRIVGGVAVSVDVDRERRAQEALAHARDDLELRVQAEVAAREAAQARLVQTEKLAALGQLAGGIAHDFNNVIQAVSGGTSLIRRRADNPASVRQLASMVEDAARRGASITRRLLAFARRDELRAEAIDIPMLLKGLREVLVHTLGPAVTVELDIAPGLVPVLADRGQLETVLVNLGTNARDAMPAGGTLTLSARVETITGGDHPARLGSGTYVRLAVTDTGTGMDAATLARATEPFFTTKELGQGTGLGLAMARGFAEQSDGGFHIVSALGHGTGVTLWLPAADAVAPEAPPQPETMAARTGLAVPRILLVDDEDLVRDTIAAHLVDHGYEVVQTRTGPDALDLLDAGEAVDLLVSDLAMPEMDGIAVIQAAQRRKPRLPAILLTGYAGEAASLAIGGAVTGTFSLLRKPVSGSQIADRIATLLEATRPS